MSLLNQTHTLSLYPFSQLTSSWLRCHVCISVFICHAWFSGTEVWKRFTDNTQWLEMRSGRLQGITYVTLRTSCLCHYCRWGWWDWTWVTVTSSSASYSDLNEWEPTAKTSVKRCYFIVSDRYGGRWDLIKKHVI